MHIAITQKACERNNWTNVSIDTIASTGTADPSTETDEGAPLLIGPCLSIIEFPECSQRVMKAVEKLRPADKLGQVMPVQV